MRGEEEEKKGEIRWSWGKKKRGKDGKRWGESERTFDLRKMF